MIWSDLVLFGSIGVPLDRHLKEKEVGPGSKGFFHGVAVIPSMVLLFLGMV